MSARLGIITYNIRHALKQPAVDEDLTKLALTGEHYLAFQEIHGVLRRHRLEDHLAEFNYGTTEFSGLEGDHKTPISFNKRFKELLEEGSEYLCEPMGAKGAGPATAFPKRATWGRFKDLSTGNIEVVINCHLPPSPHIFQRGLLHKEAIENLTTLAKRLRNKYEADTLVCGDMNTDYYSVRGKARFDNLIAAGFTANWSHFPKDIPSFPGHNAHIDWVIGNIVPKHQAVMLGYNSDHRPVRVRY